MTLTHAEAHSPLWAKLKEHFTAQRDDFQLKNNSLRTSEQDTTVYRAHILLLNQLIDLDKPFREKE